MLSNLHRRLQMDPEICKKLYTLDGGPDFKPLSESEIEKQYLAEKKDVVDMNRIYHIYLRNGFGTVNDELTELSKKAEYSLGPRPFSAQALQEFREQSAGIWIRPSFLNNK